MEKRRTVKYHLTPIRKKRRPEMQGTHSDFSHRWLFGYTPETHHKTHLTEEVPVWYLRIRPAIGRSYKPGEFRIGADQSGTFLQQEIV